MPFWSQWGPTSLAHRPVKLTCSHSHDGLVSTANSDSIWTVSTKRSRQKEGNWGKGPHSRMSGCLKRLSSGTTNDYLGGHREPLHSLNSASAFVESFSFCLPNCCSELIKDGIVLEEDSGEIGDKINDYMQLSRTK